MNSWSSSVFKLLALLFFCCFSSAVWTFQLIIIRDTRHKTRCMKQLLLLTICHAWCAKNVPFWNLNYNKKRCCVHWSLSKSFSFILNFNGFLTLIIHFLPNLRLGFVLFFFSFAFFFFSSVFCFSEWNKLTWTQWGTCALNVLKHN